jgi:hypothetical protein
MPSVDLEENVEIVLAAYARFNGGDRTGLSEYADLAA